MTAASSCPRAWSEEDLLDALQGADFHEVKVVSEAHGSRPWLVRATQGGC